MNKVYEEQEDGSLVPLKIPSYLVTRVNILLWLKGHGLTTEEIKYLWDGQTVTPHSS